MHQATHTLTWRENVSFELSRQKFYKIRFIGITKMSEFSYRKLDVFIVDFWREKLNVSKWEFLGDFQTMCYLPLKSSLLVSFTV